MKIVGMSLKSILSAASLAAGVLCAGSVLAANLPVYGQVSDIVEDTVVLTGNAVVTSKKAPGGGMNVTVHFAKVAGRNAMSGVGLQAAADGTIAVPAGATKLNVPVTLFPAGSTATDPLAFGATAVVQLNVDATGAVVGGATQFTINLTPVIP
jgi:hypothetical protein